MGTCSTDSKSKKQKQSWLLAGLFALQDHCRTSEGILRLEYLAEHPDASQSTLTKHAIKAYTSWKHACLIEGLSPVVWTKQYLQFIFNDIIDQPLSISQIKWVARVFTNAAKKFYRTQPQDAKIKSCTLCHNDWERLERTAIACFLSDWLRNNPDMKQSLYDFALNPFGERRSFDTVYTSKEEYYSILLRVHDDIRTLLEMRQIQANNENTFAAPIKPADSPKYAYSYVELCALELAISKYAESRLRIFRYITRRKDILSIRAEHDEAYPLLSAFDDYYAILNDIKSLEDIALKDDLQACKRYVASSMAIGVLEESTRLYLASTLFNFFEKKGTNNTPTLRTINNELYESLWARIPSFPNQRFSRNPDPASSKSTNYELGCAHNILNYSRDVDALFNHSTEYSEIYVMKQLILRKELNDLRGLLLLLFPNQHSWTDQDFRSAFDFYRQEYNIVDTLIKYPLPNLDHVQPHKKGARRNKDAFDRYRSIYLHLLSMAESSVDNAYKIFKASRRKN